MQKSHIQKNLEKKVKKLAIEMFGWEMDKPVIISNRMKRTLGQYVWKIDQDTKRPELVKFQFAGKLFDGGFKEEDIDWIIKHELVHWYTDISQGRPCHHNKRWKANCRRFGIPDSRLTKLEAVGNSQDYRWKYQCSNSNCRAVYRRYRRIPKGYVCGKCRGRLEEFFLKD
ncbi:MAG: hypothetical protein GX375_01635 [Clostridiales bacterium]|nr:hypothetical protein [Clostridiales bacterium]